MSRGSAFPGRRHALRHRSKRRTLPRDGTTRSRGNGDSIQGVPRIARPVRRHEGAAPRFSGGSFVHRALHPRGARGGQARTSPHRPDLRLFRVRGPAIPGDEVGVNCCIQFHVSISSAI
jgi:hypothetical protein